jgi:hypothetical protein
MACQIAASKVGKSLLLSFLHGLEFPDDLLQLRSSGSVSALLELRKSLLHKMEKIGHAHHHPPTQNM